MAEAATKQEKTKLVSVYPMYELVLKGGKAHFVDVGGNKFKRVQDEKPVVLKFTRHVAYVEDGVAKELKANDPSYGQDYMSLADYKAAIKAGGDSRTAARGFEKTLARFAKQKEPGTTEEYRLDLVESILEKQ
jgi:hypothetical protein